MSRASGSSLDLSQPRSAPQLDPHQPTPLGRKRLCKIVRTRAGLSGRVAPRYDLYEEQADGSRTFVLSAWKRTETATSGYCISASQERPASSSSAGSRRDGVVAKVRSNALGTAFAITDARGASPSRGPSHIPMRRDLAAVMYETNVLGLKGPRKMHVVVPSMTKTGERKDLRPAKQQDTLVERYRQGRISGLLVLHNKQPVWSEETQSYVLNFGGRVTLASVKNFQIVHGDDPDYIVAQFGRVSSDTFTLDWQYPFSAVQAFAIALTSFDAKIACE